MSSYTDADANQSDQLNSSNFVQNRLKTICINQMNPKPHNFYLDRSGKTIFFCCLILIIVYLKFFCLSYPMIKTIYSKDEYFHRELQIEKEKIFQQKKQFEQLLDNWKSQRYSTDVSCRRCSSFVTQIDRQQIFRILDNQQHTKEEYNQTLFPLQLILILLCLLNNIFIIFIFENAIQLFLPSNLFLILSFGIYAEFFIQERPNVYFTLLIALFILLFTIFFLFQVFKTCIIIRDYQMMKKIMTNVHFVEH